MALADVLAAATVHPVTVGWLDFKTDPLRGWDGPGAFAPVATGNSDLDGNTFVHAEGPVLVSDITDGGGIGQSLSITFSAGEMDDEEAFLQLVVDQRLFMGRTAKLWRFFLEDDESAVLSDFSVLFSGVMVGAEMTREAGSPALVTITCDQDLGKARFGPARWIDHQQFYSTDTWSTFVNDIGRKPIASAPLSPEDRRQRNVDQLLDAMDLY